MTDDRLIYRIPEVCEILRISYATFNRRVHAGDIVVHKLGSVSIVKRESLDNFLKALPKSTDRETKSRDVNGLHLVAGGEADNQAEKPAPRPNPRPRKG